MVWLATTASPPGEPSPTQPLVDSHDGTPLAPEVLPPYLSSPQHAGALIAVEGSGRIIRSINRCW